jgi:hypothetical protein
MSGGTDLPRGLARAATDVTRNLIQFALGPELTIARRAAGNLLRHALDLLSDSLDFLCGCLPAKRCHALSSLEAPVKQEVFRFATSSGATGNSSDGPRRLSCQET